ncbi:MAG: RidA family protein [Alphaproteobacteria bacterium]|nr:RidA family protein [Alphaproteobacteria bacterium]
MILQEKLQEHGYELPKAAAPAANYVPYVITGNLIHVSGQIPFLNGEEMHIGRLGEDMSLEDGVKAAEACALNILAQVNDAVDGDWSRVKRCIKLGGFVNSTPDFCDQPRVINGASDLIGKIMGEAGKHARFAVGAPSLPLGIAVEIDAIFEVEA